MLEPFISWSFRLHPRALALLLFASKLSSAILFADHLSYQPVLCFKNSAPRQQLNGPQNWGEGYWVQFVPQTR